MHYYANRRYNRIFLKHISNFHNIIQQFERIVVLPTLHLSNVTVNEQRHLCFIGGLKEPLNLKDTYYL